jgi:WD40 repeat protein
LFTHCDDDRQREEFLAALAHSAVSAEGARTAVVVAVRADFYGRCLDYAVLEDALKHRGYLLGPMRMDELAEAITGPAELAGYRLETGLEELIVAELCGIGGRADRVGYDPGALPLLSHVMAAAWQRREGGRLTIDGYRAAGGVLGSVAATAEQAWTELTGVQRMVGKHLLLGLVTVGRDSKDTRRKVPRPELIRGGADAADAALEALARTRLVTLDAGDGDTDPVAYLTHEIVLDAWPRLRGWIDEDRIGYLERQRLAGDATDWAATGRDPSRLYRGERLAAVLAHAEHVQVGPVAEEFLGESLSAHRRASRRAHATKAALSLLGVVILALTGVAGVQRNHADRQRDDAIFDALLSEADRLTDADPSVSALLDLVAYRLRPDDGEVRSRVLGTQNLPLATTVATHAPQTDLAFGAGGRLLAGEDDDGPVRLWNVADPRHPGALGGPIPAVKTRYTSMALRPDGAILATLAADRGGVVWDVRNARSPRPVAAIPGIGGPISFAPSGRILAAQDSTGAVLLWDLADPAHPMLAGTLPADPAGPTTAVAFSPDGRLLATGDDAGALRLWDIAAPAAPALLSASADAAVNAMESLAFSLDGTKIAAGSLDGHVTFWDVTQPQTPRTLGVPAQAQTCCVLSVAFSPDSHVLAAAGDGPSPTLWDAIDSIGPRALDGSLAGGASDTVHAVGFSPDGRTIATATSDGKLQLWSFPPAPLVGRAQPWARPMFDADGSRLVGVGYDGRLDVWDARDPLAPRLLGSPSLGRSYYDSSALSPDGRTLAAIDYDDRGIRLYDLSDPTVARPEALLPITASGVPDLENFGMAFSADSHVLVAEHDPTSLQVWDVSRPAGPVPLGAGLRVGPDRWQNTPKFAGNRTVLVACDGGAAVEIWSLADPSRPVLVGRVPSDDTRRRIVSFDITADRRTLVVGDDDGTIRLWDIADQVHPTAIGRPDITGENDLFSVNFSPDGHELATSAAGGRVRLWRVADPAGVEPIGESIASATTGHRWSIAFDPRGGYLAGGSFVKVLRLWDLDPGHAVARICAIVGPSVTRDLWREYLPRLPYRPPCLGG